VHADFSAAQLSSADDADALAVQVENARSRPCECPQEAEAMLHTVTTALRLSPRSAQLVRAVAMSIARLDGCSLVTAAHIEESASYRFRNLA
jgi:predicted ATPase with chaperone activity